MCKASSAQAVDLVSQQGPANVVWRGGCRVLDGKRLHSVAGVDEQLGNPIDRQPPAGIVTSSYWVSFYDVGDAVFVYSDGDGLPAPGELNALIQALSESMPGYNPASYFAAQPDIFNRYEHLVVAKSNPGGRTMGLLGARWFDRRNLPVLHLWTGMVATSSQRRGLVRRMFAHLLGKALETNQLPLVIAAKTSSPLWYKVMQRLTASLPGACLYPNLEGPQTSRLTSIALRVCRQVTPTLKMDPATGVIRGARVTVGPDFFPRDRPLSGDAVLDAFFEHNVTKDDQILTVIDLSSVQPRDVEELLHQGLNGEGSG